MKNILTGILFLFMFSSFAQQTTEWIRLLENPEFETDSLKNENSILKYLHYNFSTLMSPKEEFLGFIGNEYKRIRIFITAINKEAIDQSSYFVQGLSRVGTNVCNFQGTIKIQQIREYQFMHYGIDSVYEKIGFKAQGLLIGNFEFKEDSSVAYSGIFKGLNTLYWYIDKFDILHFDNIKWYSDRYCNNQYVGTWTQYNNQKSKICNWGESRIPFSNDLDQGAAEFSPNSKYIDQGWDDYIYK